MSKSIKVAVHNVAHDYCSSFLPILIQSLGYRLEWVSPKNCDLLIYGPFGAYSKKYRWLPRAIRPYFDLPIWGRRSPPLTLFHTAENARPDNIQADFSIGYDLGILSDNYLRFPYWMEMLDWSSQGLVGNLNHRFGGLLSIEALMKPLGEVVIQRQNKAAFFTSHLREPRKSIFQAISQVIEVDGYGPYFNQLIINHNASGLYKRDILSGYRFNLCPENGCFPGYYTEKIPEAFSAGCIPITWADSNVSVDFNPLAMINLFETTGNNYEGLADMLFDIKYLEKIASEPLLLKMPDIQIVKKFVKNILEQATN